MAAFDTVNYDLLLLRLERQFGLCGVVLRWFQSYLSDRSFRVIYFNQTSSIVHIVCSVPQESVLGSRLFVLCMADLVEELQQYHVNFHTYTDDSQLYLHCRRDDKMSAVDRLERCLTVSATGCPLTVSNLTLRRQNCCEPARDITQLYWTAMVHLYDLVMKCSCRATVL